MTQSCGAEGRNKKNCLDLDVKTIKRYFSGPASASCALKKIVQVFGEYNSAKLIHVVNNFIM